MVGQDRHITPNQSASFGGLISIVGKNKFPVEARSYQDPPLLFLRYNLAEMETDQRKAAKRGRNKVLCEYLDLDMLSIK